MCLLVTYMSSLEKFLLLFFSYFLTGFFVFLVLTSMSCLYILEIILCQLFHFLLFSSILRVVFSPCLVSFAMQKCLSLIRSHFFYFCFKFHYSRRWVMEDLAVISVQTMFSSESFIVCGITFRSLIHFDFIFVYVVRKYSNFIFFLM